MFSNEGIYYLFYNYYGFFTFELFVSYFSPHYEKKKKVPLRIAFLILFFVLSFAPPISARTFFAIYIPSLLLYIFVINNNKLKSTIITLIKFFISESILGIISALIFFWYTSYLGYPDDNNIFFKYIDLNGCILFYLILNLYINQKQLKAANVKNYYHIYFTLMSILVVIFMMIASQNLYGYEELIDIMPIVYFMATGLIMVTLSQYRKMIEMMINQSKQDIMLEKHDMESSFYLGIEKALNELASLRHDFSNHLIVIDGYAKDKELTKLHNYIEKLNNTVTTCRRYQTEHHLVSAIINTKADICFNSGIRFNVSYSFEKITLEDFYIITILGNILDNAVTAAGKIEDGFINFSITQLDSYLEIKCENNHIEKIKYRQGTFLSTKSNQRLFHGIGLKNVQNSVNELQGTMDVKHNKDNFSVEILVPNY